MNSSPDADPPLHVVILAGGIGSRFWPASTAARPKPLLPLGRAGRPLLREAIARAELLGGKGGYRILAGAHLAEPFRAAVPELDDDQLLIEPRARGTAPVLVWAAHRVHRETPGAVLVSLHADHRIEPEEALVRVVREGARIAAGEDLLLTIAVPPDRPESGYGYIRPGPPLETDAAAFHVDAFVEKPDPDTAASYLRRGYLWNSGIFLFPVARFLEEVRLHAGEISEHLHLLDEGKDDLFFDRVAPISVDEAVLERSGRVGAIRATFRWDDVGGWEALARTLDRDLAGNATWGRVHAVSSRENVVWAEEDGSVVLFGVEGLVVVRSGQTTLVTTREHAPELKELLRRLPEPLRDGEAGR